MKRLALGLAAACALALAGCGTPSHHAIKQSATGSVRPAGWAAPQPGLLPHTFGVTAPAATREMYDSITLATVPANPVAVAGYTAGFWPTYLPMVHAFPHAVVLSIAIAARYHAMCLDVEPGDAVPSQAAAWVRQVQALIRSGAIRGISKPCVYGSLWEYVNQIRPALAAAGIRRSDVFEWDADYTFVRHLDPSFDATQWTDKALGRNLDESTVTLPMLGLEPKPKPMLPVCIHHRESKAACATAKAKVASDLRAVASSQRALATVNATLTANHCVKPYRRGVCRKGGLGAQLFSQRVRYFTAKAAELQAAN